ncbi:MAG: protein-disulfide reductase DsbD family protein, partial [Campylobacterota bacterium]|nr:protein-disulfide reductase DsbD family protein [Campylobacterota bacterium]
MFKHIIVWVSFLTLLLGSSDFLEPKKAFQSSVKEQDSNIVFNLTLAKDIYIYDEQLKVEIKTDTTTDITSKLGIRKAVDFHDFMVHFEKMDIEVPKSLIEELTQGKPYELVFNYQGCSSAGLCYQPMNEVYKSADSIVETPVKKASFALAVKKDTPTVVAPIIEQNESDSIAQTLKDGNVFIILGTF